MDELAHLSSRTLFGAAAFWDVTEKQADQVLELLLEYGVNHIDVAASYGDAELRVGPWMQSHRDDFFLATKSEERGYQGAKDQLQQSLQRLQVDQIDLWQMHFLVDEEGWQTVMERAARWRPSSKREAGTGPLPRGDRAWLPGPGLPPAQSGAL